MLTRTEIENATGGRGLNRLVAPLAGWTYRQDIGRWIDPTGEWAHVNPPEFSDNIAAAWDLVEAMAIKGFWLKLVSPFYPGQLYFAAFDQHGVTDSRPPWEASGDTAALAICKSALLVMQASAQPTTEKGAELC
jgi:hypothetical protein